MEHILLQAIRYGEQVSMLDNHGMEAERQAVRDAYTAFRRQFQHDRDQLRIVSNAYYDGYWGVYKI